MRILKISDVYFPRVNGVSTSIQTFRRAFAEHGHDVTLIAPDYGDSGDGDLDALGRGDDHADDDARSRHFKGGAIEDADGVIRIPSRTVPVDPEDRLMQTGPIRALVDRLKQERYDLVHIHTPFVAHYLGRYLGKQLDIPVIESYHTFFEEYLAGYLPLVPQSMLKFAARRFSASQCNAVDAIVVPSRPMLEVLRGYGVTARAEVIPTGIQLAEFAQGDGAAFRARHGIGPGRKVLVHVGRVAHEKNIGFLIDVLERVKVAIPDVLLVIAGEGPATRPLKKTVAARGLEDNVLFVGYLRRGASLNSCYQAADAFVFASRTETQGLVLLEAMALGVPVVSTAVMGTLDVLGPGKGALVADEDVTDFAAKCLHLLEDQRLAQSIGAAGKAYAATWAAPVLARRMLDYYREVIEAAPVAEVAPAAASQPETA